MSSEHDSKKRRLEGCTVVLIYVGPSLAHFLVHKEPLCKHSTFFDKALSSNSKEGQKQTLKLLEDSVDVFNTFIGWLYGGDAALCDDTSVPWTKVCNDNIKLYVFAHKYGIPQLQEDSWTTIAWGLEQDGVFPGLSEAIVMWRCTESGITQEPRRTGIKDYAVLAILDQRNLDGMDDLQKEVPDLTFAVMRDFAKKYMKGLKKKKDEA